MKKILFLFFLLVTFTTYAQKTASVMSVSGKDINDAIKNYPDGILILRLSTNDGLNVFPDCFIYNKGGAPRFVPLVLTPLITSSLVDYYPFTVTTLKWKYDEDMEAGDTFIDGEIYYFIPIVYNRHLTYTIMSLGELKKISGLSNISDFKDLSVDDRKKLMTKLANSGSSFNPIPPRLVP